MGEGRGVPVKLFECPVEVLLVKAYTVLDWILVHSLLQCARDRSLSKLRIQTGRKQSNEMCLFVHL